MTISYRWLSDYIPDIPSPHQLSLILTAIGLEVESMEQFESIRGNLEGIKVGEVTSCSQHPNADKLKLTTVDVGIGQLLQVVCGATNVAVGQKVVVATIGTTIYPVKGEPLMMKAVKIRGIESQGMICAEDEIGIGPSHEGIIVLPADVTTGTSAADYYKPYTDVVYEIGLTPNRMDAMSHYGVARDVCAYLSYHYNRDCVAVSPFTHTLLTDNHTYPIGVSIENTTGCRRYAGVTLSGITVRESPKWLKDKLSSIGLRPINNVVDVTNFILHETGQPLHAFDADEITGRQIVVKDAINGAAFVTLDGKERKLDNRDLMICNTAEPMCIAGVFGGSRSGVKENTTNIFLESAWFDPAGIRKTSLRLGLRTDAATRFEKGVDIFNTVNSLKRAALLLLELAGGAVSSDITDVYPEPINKKRVNFTYAYLKKISGKYYPPEAVKKILLGLGFEIESETDEMLEVMVPHNKLDISLPADIAEEILRIDGLDNIQTTGLMLLHPSADKNTFKEAVKEKLSGFLIGQGFSEIVTNSITNSRYYSDEQLERTVRMINNLSAELNIMRPSMVETGLEAIVYNTNRKNNHLKMYEFGKTYKQLEPSKYTEQEHLALYITGNADDNWKQLAGSTDFFKAKGLAYAIAELCGLRNLSFHPPVATVKAPSLICKAGDTILGSVFEIPHQQLQEFDLKQPVYVIDFDWLTIVQLSGEMIVYSDIPKFPAVQRDLAIIVKKSIPYSAVEDCIKNLSLPKLQRVVLFDVFESDKFGAGNKSMALNFIFIDEDKTLTDKETESMMRIIIDGLEKQVMAVVRN